MALGNELAAQDRWPTQSQGAGPVRKSWDPSVFEWVDPSKLMSRVEPTICVHRNGLYISLPATEEMEEWARRWLSGRVSVGFAARAIAVRLSNGGRSYKVLRNPKARSRISLAIHSVTLAELATEKGFPPGTILVAEIDRAHDMIVGVKPKQPEPKHRQKKG